MQRPPNVCFCDVPETTPGAGEFYTSVLKKIREIVHLTVFNLNTLLDRGPLWQYNTIKNLPHLLTHPGIATLAGLFAGRPAIVVGAGPSLNDALPSLRAAAKRFVLLATGTALRKLRKAGIQPDLVVAVDASRKTAPQFETRCDDVYLACSSIVYPPAIPKFKGIFSGQLEVNPIDNWLNTLGAPKGAWAAAGTVTTTAIDLAIRMGCNPVISVGFDLSFSDDGTTHASDTMYHGHRLDPRQLVQVPGNYRPEVPTTEQFHVYIRLLDEYVKSLPDIRFINATTGGAKLNGMELMKPEGLAALSTDPFDAAALIAGVHQAYTEDVRVAAQDELRTVAEELKTTVANAQEAARLSNRLIMLLRAPHKEDEAPARELLQALDTLDRQFLDMGRSALFLDMSLWPGAYQTRTGRSEEEASFSEGVWVNRRSRQLYEQIVGAATWTRLLLLDVADELDRRAPSASFEPARTDNAGKRNESQRSLELQTV
ncbi:MAG: DUF115 domain-containing protein [Lentisphaerae bacterium]|nr:DUF115 domain-containing protein [Lentisphaerota bacterium]